ncbi:hypothetical protein [Streptomyces sp. NPDC002671]
MVAGVEGQPAAQPRALGAGGVEPGADRAGVAGVVQQAGGEFEFFGGEGAQAAAAEGVVEVPQVIEALFKVVDHGWGDGQPTRGRGGGWVHEGGEEVVGGAGKGGASGDEERTSAHWPSASGVRQGMEHAACVHPFGPEVT